MKTIAMECPKCGAPGSVPRDKVQARLVCKKCHAIFHLTVLGRAVLGEPPVSEGKHDDHHHPHVTAPTVSEATEFVVSRTTLLMAALIVLIALALGLGVQNLFSRSGPSGDAITPRAEAVANAIAHDSLESLKQGVLPGHEPELSRFFESTRQLLAPVRSHSATKELEAKILVLELTDNQTKAQVVGYFTPKRGSAREQQIAEAEAEASSSAGAGKATSADLMLWFAKDAQGKWKLDAGKSIRTKTGA